MKLLDTKKVTYEPGVIITAKEFEFEDGHREVRYFLYSCPEITTCGGRGWKSLEKLIARYIWYVDQGHIKPPVIKSLPDPLPSLGDRFFQMV